MRVNASIYRYPSQRTVIYANKGMVCSSTPQAAQAGIAVMRRGGNAIDAAVAAAATLPVVEPSGNGVGGDAFALVWSGGRLHGLNASGPCAAALSAGAIRDRGYSEMPLYGWLPVTVPGIPSAWAALNKRFGRLPLTEVMEPAISYARDGFPLSSVLGRLWRRTWDNFSSRLKGEAFSHFFEHFSVDGRCPETGEVWRSEALAKTLQSIAESGAESFYRGEIAERIAHFAAQTDGFLTVEDLAAFSPEWVEPICTDYRGYDVWEMPPNGQGIVALMALNILNGLELSPHREDERNYHLQIEAIKLAFADAKRYVADRSYMKDVKVEDLLSKAYADDRRRLIGEKASLPEPGRPNAGGTVYLSTADGEGNMVSYIQSNYRGYGSGLVVPGTGIALHNRGNNFTLEDGHPNCLAPGKRPYHTIIPGFLTQNGEPVGPFGIMGGFLQPQAHVQVMCSTLDFGLNPQDALSAPRWQWTEGKKVEIEHAAPLSVLQALSDRGHDLSVPVDSSAMGKGEIIWRLENGVLCGGTEPRADGTIAVY